MYRVAIVGAGQLGSRHLQGLSQMALACEIFVVDPSPASLDVARQRFAQAASDKSQNKKVSYHLSIEELPSTLDYVVVATNADIRLRVMQTLLESRQVRSMLLEKVLFQKTEDYHIAEALLATHNVRAWVNCWRRAMGIYRDVQNFFAGDALRYFQVRGGMWGLGCNSVHYLDLLSWLTNEVPSAFETAALDSRVIKSKRPGFIEFTGTLQGLCGEMLFEITSVADSDLPSLMTFRSESKTCIVDEGSRRAYFLAHDPGRHYAVEDFELPPVSQLTTVFGEEILLHRTSGLVSYEEAKTYHLPFIEALGGFAAQQLGTSPAICQIT